MGTFRIGTGFDVHRLVPGRDLKLGGVKIDHDKGLLGHSDADVALHALADAMLGAAALGDIGKAFPDSDDQWKDADSRMLLRLTTALLLKAGYAVANADITIIAQAPKIAPHVPQMRQNIAADLRVTPEAISVKATTTEGLGFTGRGEGIAAQASVLIVPLTPAQRKDMNDGAVFHLV